LLMAIAAFGFVALSPQVELASGAPCAHADDTHAEASIAQLRNATLCLVNRRRAQRDKGRLDRNAEPSLGQRIRRTGYLNGASRWRFAESTGCKRTPRRMVNAWMSVRFHRRNLLEPAYRDLGAGLKARSPDVGGCKGNPDLTTYTVVVAFRRG
jgi:hypothetical protein